MANALCGPSNALQSFGKHSQLDRTLQQDRLVSQHPSQSQQGFRTRDPRAGALDAELHAFEHGTPPPPAMGLFHQQQQQPQNHQQHSPFGQQTPTTQGGWAADFQRLHISQTPSPGPIPVQRFREEAPLVRSAGPGMGWGAEFMRAQQQQGQQQGQQMGKEVFGQPEVSMQQGYGFMSGAGGMDMSMGYGVQQPQPQMGLMEQSQHQQQDGQLSQADFDAAFEEAMVEVERYQEEQQQQHQQEQQQSVDDEAPSTLEKSDIRIGSDAIDYREQADRTPEQDQRDADELARTAGHLLNLVQHDTSTKFQNSQFLDLMRKIRDREVEVQDNDLQATAGLPESQMRAEPPLAQQDAAASDMRPHDPNQFSFPNLDAVYAPTATDLDSNGADTFDPAAAAAQQQQQQQHVPAGSWQNPSGPMQATPNASDADAMYTSAADEYPQSDLHPGGRFYPEMSPRMSGARMTGFDGNAASAAQQGPA